MEGSIITPRIVGEKVGLHPIVTILALLIGGQLFGILGMLLAVPVTKLYDKGTTMAPAVLLESHTGESALTINPATGLKIGLSNGGQAKLKLDDLEMEAAVRFDETVSTGVVLVYRSFGIPISEPTTVELLAVPQDSTISAAEKLRR